jgi:L-ascorbate metabolism protein UlaG (beta-lactamase superfamily)
MRIKWLAHATFLIEGEGIRIVTDPYTPEVMGFPAIQESADIVIRSSADDAGHCNAAMVGGNPLVLTATEWGEEVETRHGLKVKAIPTQESLIHKEKPADNAMYRLTLEGIRISHMGDVGNRLTEDHLRALSSTDVLLAPTGGPPTLDLDDLCDAIKILRPRLVIPMHYHLPETSVKMLPVSEFANRFPSEAVEWGNSAEVELHASNLPTTTRVLILKPGIFHPNC